jgi:hypothetical protein
MYLVGVPKDLEYSPFKYVAVSNDLLTLVVCHRCETLLVVDLDDYYQLFRGKRESDIKEFVEVTNVLDFASNQQRLHSEDVKSNGIDFQRRSKVLSTVHWFEQPGAFSSDKGVTRNFEYRPPGRHLTSLSSPVNKALNGLNVQSDNLPANHHQDSAHSSFRSFHSLTGSNQNSFRNLSSVRASVSAHLLDTSLIVAKLKEENNTLGSANTSNISISNDPLAHSPGANQFASPGESQGATPHSAAGPPPKATGLGALYSGVVQLPIDRELVDIAVTHTTILVYLRDSRKNRSLFVFNRRAVPKKRSGEEEDRRLGAALGLEYEASYDGYSLQPSGGLGSEVRGDMLSTTSHLLMLKGEGDSYYITSGGLWCTLSNGPQTQQELLNHLIMFDTASSANKLCEMNGWDSRSLRLNALSLGLKFRQPNVIEPALNGLDQDQQLTGSRTLLDYIHNNTLTSQDEEFFDQLLQIAMDFVSKMITTKATELLKKSTPGDRSKRFARFEWISPATLGHSTAELPSIDSLMGGENDSIFSNVMLSTTSLSISSDHELPTIEEQLIGFANILESLRSIYVKSKTSRQQGSQSIGVIVKSRGTPSKAVKVEQRKSLKPRVLFSQNSQSEANSTVLAALANLTNGGSLGSLGSIDLSDMELDQMAEKFDEQKRLPSLGLLQRQGSQMSTVEMVNDNEELQAAFSSIHLRWERMERIEVIRDALLNGLLSLAQSFLQFKRRKSVSLPSASPQPSVQSAEDHSISWEQLKRTCFCLIYQAVIHNQIDVATKMLCNLGQDLYSNFKEIAFQTTRRSIRSALLSLLEQTNKVSLDERVLLDFVRLLESKYPNSDYYLEYTRRSAIENNSMGAMTGGGGASASVESGFSPKGPSGSTAIEFSGLGGDQDLIKISCDDLDDLTSEAERKYDFQLLGRQRSGGLYGSAVSSMSSGRARSLSGNMRAANAAISKNKIAICPSAKSDSYSTNYHRSEDSTSMAKGYLHLSLAWAKAWNDETRGRILLETMKDASSVDLYSQLRYYIAHNDWRHIVSWVKQFCIHLQHSSIEANPPRQELLDRVTLAAADATTFVSELLFNELAKQRIFLTPATEVNPFEAMMKRLTRTGQLFTHSLGESFHTPFVAFCIEKNLPGVLQAYLDFFQLARTPQEVQAIGLGQTAKREWAQFFGFLRAHTDIFGAAIVNAKLLLRSGSGSSSIFGSVRGGLNIETILLSGRVLLAIGTALLAPVSISEVLRQDNASQLEQLADKPWYFTKRTLKDSIKSFPYLEKALFGNSSTINSTTSFINPAQFLPEVDRLFRKSSPFSTSTLPYLRRGHLLSPSMAAINQTEEVLPSFADPSRFVVDVYTDNIDVSYYLSKGRPLQAFDLFVRERREARKGTGGGLPATTSSGPLESMIFPALTAREGEELQSYIRDLSFQHLLESSALSACVAFLELCGLDSQALRVDIQAALRIHHSKQLWKQPSAGSITSLNTTPTPTVSSLQAVVKLFQGFKTNPSALNSALQLLETATKTAPSLHATSSASSLLATAGYLPSGILSDIPTMSIVKQQFEKKENDPWLLISLFCHTHNLILSTCHLTELAKQNDWVNFLYEAQTHKFPVHQVLETVPNFRDKQLREHLYIVVRNNSQDEDNTTGSLNWDLAASGKEDVFQAVLSVMDPKAKKTITAGQALLAKSLEQNRPFFAVIAPCFKGISRLDCITCWFISAYPSLLDFLLLPSVPGASRTTNVEWTLQDLHTAIVTLCEENELLSLRRGFMIFDLKNPILIFLDFYRAFIQNRFSECQEPLHSFVAIVAGKSPSVFQVGTVDWVSSLAMELIDRRLNKSLSPYEQSHLLRLLAESDLNDQYRKQWRTFSVLQKTNISLDLSADPLTLVDLLLEKGLYSDARSYSLANDIPPHHITVAEALALVKEYQKGSLWAQEHERRVLWNRCQSLFIQHGCSSELAGTFFLEQAKLHTQSSKEYAFLLSTALDWFNGTHSPDGEACKSPEFLQELENRMLLLSVSAEVGELSSPKMLGSSPSMISSPQVSRRERSSSSASVNTWTKNVEEGNEQVLHVTVNRLLSVGNLSKAEAICNQFKYDR